MTPRPKGVGVIITDGADRVWVSQRSPTVRSFPGIWQLPGGTVEAGEDPIDAAARELHEETDVYRCPGDLAQVLAMSAYHPSGVYELHIYHCHRSANTLRNMEPEKCGPWVALTAEEIYSKGQQCLPGMIPAIHRLHQWGWL